MARKSPSKVTAEQRDFVGAPAPLDDEGQFGFPDFNAADGSLAGELGMAMRGAEIAEETYDNEFGFPKAELIQMTLDSFDRLEDKAAMYGLHADVRARTAAKFRAMHEATGRREYLTHADKLEDARQWFNWGTDLYADDEPKPVIHWYDRAGYVKYCPDDARDQAMRVEQRYLPRIEDLQLRDCHVQYAVMERKNVPLGFLAAEIHDINRAFRDRFFYARIDGKRARSIDDPMRVFPSLVGALVTVEAPLSRRGDWNVHLNAILIFRDPGPGKDVDNWRRVRERDYWRRVPNWTTLQKQWGAGSHFQEVPIGAGAAALRELLKYAFKAISLKSEEKQGHAGAPPWVDWPIEAADEWHMAHKRFRRTRGLGLLEGRKCPALSKLARWIKWHGHGVCYPGRFEVCLPEAFERADLYLIIGDKFARRRQKRGVDPPPKSPLAAANQHAATNHDV